MNQYQDWERNPDGTLAMDHAGSPIARTQTAPSPPLGPPTLATSMQTSPAPPLGMISAPVAPGQVSPPPYAPGLPPPLMAPPAAPPPPANPMESAIILLRQRNEALEQELTRKANNLSPGDILLAQMAPADYHELQPGIDRIGEVLTSHGISMVIFPDVVTLQTADDATLSSYGLQRIPPTEHEQANIDQAEQIALEDFEKQSEPAELPEGITVPESRLKPDARLADPTHRRRGKHGKGK